MKFLFFFNRQFLQHTQLFTLKLPKRFGVKLKNDGDVAKKLIQEND